MWTSRTKTVASVMESFRKTIVDLQEIIEVTITKNSILNERRTALDEAIEMNNLEIHQAGGIESRLNTLVFGSDPVVK